MNPHPQAVLSRSIAEKTAAFSFRLLHIQVTPDEPSGIQTRRVIDVRAPELFRQGASGDKRSIPDIFIGP